MKTKATILCTLAFLCGTALTASAMTESSTRQTEIMCPALSNGTIVTTTDCQNLTDEIAFLGEEKAKMILADYFNVPLNTLFFTKLYVKGHGVKPEALELGSVITEGRTRHMLKYMDNVPPVMTPELLAQIPTRFYRLEAYDAVYKYKMTIDAFTGKVFKAEKKQR